MKESVLQFEFPTMERRLRVTVDEVQSIEDLCRRHDGDGVIHPQLEFHRNIVESRTLKRLNTAILTAL